MLRDERIIWQLVRLCVKHESKSPGAIMPDGKINLHLSYRYAFSKDAEKALMSGLKHGYFKRTSEYGSVPVELTEKGEALAKQETPPDWIRPKPPKLTEELLDLLNDLVSWKESAERQSDKYAITYGAAPLDLGGGNGSHHSRSLMQLCALGLARSDLKSGYPRPPSIYKKAKGSRKYWPTEAGIEKNLEWKAARK